MTNSHKDWLGLPLCRRRRCLLLCKEIRERRQSRAPRGRIQTPGASSKARRVYDYVRQSNVQRFHEAEETDITQARREWSERAGPRRKSKFGSK